MVQVKKWVQLMKKWALDPKKPWFSKIWGVKCPFFDPQYLFFFRGSAKLDKVGDKVQWNGEKFHPS